MTSARLQSKRKRDDEKLSDPRHRDWLDEEGDSAYPVAAEELPDLTPEMSGLDVYMARLRNFPPLSDDDQEELARRYHEDGEARAGHLLVMTNLRLVITLAMDYSRDRSELFELIQEGNVGISKALDRFDPSRNVRFTSYAQYWIRAKILDYLINRGRMIRLGASRAGRKVFYNLHEARRALRSRGLEPTVERVADVLDVEPSEVVRVGSQMDTPPASLEEEIDDEGGRTLGDLIESDAPTPESVFGESEFFEKVREELQAFGAQLTDPRRRAIWHERTIAEEPKILRVLGDEWGVSKERIRQIEVELCDEFRRYFAEKMGGEKRVREALCA